MLKKVPARMVQPWMAKNQKQVYNLHSSKVSYIFYTVNVVLIQAFLSSKDQMWSTSVCKSLRLLYHHGIMIK